MDQSLVLQAVEKYVHNQLGGDSSGHDMFHIERVRTVAKNLGKKEGANMFLVEMIALLHESIDYKMGDEEIIMENNVRKFLSEQGFTSNQVDNLVYDIKSVGWRGGKNPYQSDSIEVKVVQDSDRIEALGAIGIARVFAFAGSRGVSIHDPSVPSIKFETVEEYKTIVKKGRGTAINHFYEKLLLLKDCMNTETGKKYALGRHKYMEQFLEEFYAEWDGTK